MKFDQVSSAWARYRSGQVATDIHPADHMFNNHARLDDYEIVGELGASGGSFCFGDFAQTDGLPDNGFRLRAWQGRKISQGGFSQCRNVVFGYRSRGGGILRQHI